MSVGLKELSDNATHEDIVEYLDNLVVDTGEKTGKATVDNIEKNHDELDTDTTNGDDHSADDVSATNDKVGEDQDEKVKDADWFDDDLKTLTTTMGVSEEKAREFGSREELDRALSLLDSAALTIGRKDAGSDSVPPDQQKQSQDQSAERKPRGPDGKFVSSKQDDASDNDYSSFKLDPEEYEEGLSKSVNSLIDHLQSRLTAYEERFSRLEQADRERAAQAAEQQFDAVVDSLGMPELFGESGKESTEELANRKTLHGDWDAYVRGLEKQGRQGKLDKSFVLRVCNMTFAEHLSKKQRKELTRRISSQSSMRMGGSATKPTDHKYSGPPERDPELQALYDELDRQSSQ